MNYTDRYVRDAQGRFVGFVADPATTPMLSAYVAFGPVVWDVEVAYPRTAFGALALVTVLFAFGSLGLLAGATVAVAHLAFAPVALALTGLATVAFAVHVLRATA